MNIRVCNKLYVDRKVVRVLEFTPARGKVEKDQDPNSGPDICSGYFGITGSAEVNVLLTDIISDS